EGAMLLLRSMNPQVLALDELTAPEDVAAVCAAANCGVSILATAHARSVEELRRRAIYAPMLEQHVFARTIALRRAVDGTRRLELEELEC
ncbi:MAG: stage III sporulation protein AB, partial [Oscillospiraceae bacterium]|nr:stage III sporulation protein AB [Oscillospiraceae bacterium]